MAHSPSRPSWKGVLEAKLREAGWHSGVESERFDSRARPFASVEELLEYHGESGLADSTTPPAYLVAEQPSGNPSYEPPADIRELFERYLRGERDFRRVILAGDDLRGLKVSDVTFSLGDLSGADLTKAELSNCKFEFTKMRSARMRSGDFLSCNFANADLEGADLRLARLLGSHLPQANLTRASLWGADLHGANLHAAVLDHADLRGVRGPRYSNNSVASARFQRSATDSWSVLRRNYTGSRLLFHLAFLAIFLLPYVGRTLFWGVVSDVQALGEQYRPMLLNVTGLPLHQHRVLSLVLGLNRGIWDIALSAALIFYNACRAFLTWRVGPLREEEERSAIIPPFDDYKFLFVAHQVVNVLFYVAIVAFAIHAWMWLTKPVWLRA